MLAVMLLAAAAIVPLDIVREAVARSEKTENLKEQYSLTQENVQRSGTKTTSKTYELAFRGGKPHRKLIRRDDLPVQGDFEPYTPNEKRRSEMMGEMVKAFDYTLAGEERVDEFDCWVLFAKPKPGYKAPSMQTSFLTQMEGRIWISKKYTRLVKLDVKSIGPVSFGWFLAKLAPGTRIYVEQTRVDDDVWMSKLFRMTYDVRILFKSLKGEMEQVQSNFRRISPAT